MNVNRFISRLCTVSRQSKSVASLNKALSSHHCSIRTIHKTATNIKVNTCMVHVRKKATTQQKLPIIYLFTKDGCTLCDEAVEVLRPHMHRFVLEKVDITLPENEHWYDLYKYDIPVFHIYEDFLFKHRVDFEALEKGLEKYKDGYYRTLQ